MTDVRLLERPLVDLDEHELRRRREAFARRCAAELGPRGFRPCAAWAVAGDRGER